MVWTLLSSLSGVSSTNSTSSTMTSNIMTCSKSIISSCLCFSSSNSLPSRKGNNSASEEGSLFLEMIHFSLSRYFLFPSAIGIFVCNKISKSPFGMGEDLHRSSNTSPVTVPPFSRKKQIVIKISRDMWPTTTGAILPILFNFQTTA